MAAAAAAVVVKVTVAELAQHTKRLSDATNENAALDQVIPAYDADLAAVAGAYNTGADPETCIAALEDVDNNIFSYLHSLVGSAGTAWGGPSTGIIGTGNLPSYSATCNKSCTAACCVYLNNLRPGIYGRSGLGGAYSQWQTSGVIVGMIQVIQQGGGTVKVITVDPPTNKAYGDYSRAGYNLVLKKPPAATSIASQVLTVSGVHIGNTATVPPAEPTVNATSGGGSGSTSEATTVTSSSGEAVSSGLSSLFSNNELLGIFAVVTGIILIVTALFGQNSLRVK
jgi:hypothetical protein